MDDEMRAERKKKLSPAVSDQHSLALTEPAVNFTQRRRRIRMRHACDMPPGILSCSRSEEACLPNWQQHGEWLKLGSHLWDGGQQDEEEAIKARFWAVSLTWCTLPYTAMTIKHPVFVHNASNNIPKATAWLNHKKCLGVNTFRGNFSCQVSDTVFH